MPVHFWYKEYVLLQCYERAIQAIYALERASAYGFTSPELPYSSKEQLADYIKTLDTVMAAIGNSAFGDREQGWQRGHYFNNALIRLLTLADKLAALQRKPSKAVIRAVPGLAAVEKERNAVVHVKRRPLRFVTMDDAIGSLEMLLDMTRALLQAREHAKAQSRCVGG
jgi:hypothetical protein